MADITRVRPEDMVELNYLGAKVYAIVEGGPERAGSRSYEIPVRVVGGPWQTGRSRFIRVRGRAVVAVFRRLKS